MNNRFNVFSSLQTVNINISILRLFFFDCSLFLSFSRDPLFNPLFVNPFTLNFKMSIRYLNLINSLKNVNEFFFYNLNYIFFYKKQLNNLSLFNNKFCSINYNNFNLFRTSNLAFVNEKKKTLKGDKISVSVYSKACSTLNNLISKHFFHKTRLTSYSYFTFNKIFFQLLSVFKKKLNKTPFFFQISNFDKITNNFFRLTKSTKFINLFDFYLNSKKLVLASKQINAYKFYLSSLIVNKINNNNYGVSKKTPNQYSVIFKKSQLYLSNESFSKNTNNLEFFKKNHLALTLNNFFHFWNKIDLILVFFFKPLFFKSLYFINNTGNGFNVSVNLNCFRESTNHYLSSFFFYNKYLTSNLTNLIPNENFHYIIRKTVIKVFNFDKFSIVTTPWYYQTLIKFLEFCSGKKVCLRFNGFLNNSLTVEEKIRCFLWSQRVKYFRKVLGPKLFLNESIQIMYLALKNKDPYLLSNWMVTTMYKISFWKYKTFLRYIKYVLRYFFWSVFRELGVKGIKFQLKGKISVAGNARTRTAFHYVGFTSHATFNNKILYNLSLVRSFTGVMGLKLWIVF